MAAEDDSKDYIEGHGDWISAVEALAKTSPLFQSIDLIIEGCIGGNEWCAYWIKGMFPKALYVGADLAPMLTTLNNDRADGGISAAQYQKLQNGQEQLTDEEGRASLVTFRANCLSPAFIASLKEHSGAQTAMLVTFNGLLALLGTDANPGDKKLKADLTPAQKVVSSDLFDLQLHLFESERRGLWDGPVDVTTRWFHQAELTAQQLEKKSIRIKDGLLIVKDEQG